MSLNLTIDQGNSAAKVALWDDGALLDQIVEPTITCAHMKRFLAPYGRPANAMLCSVSAKESRLTDIIAKYADNVSRLTNSTPLPITIDYRTPSTLGTDRIAAAVGAWASFAGQPLLVVDAGTAVTYDAVTADGHFVGGNIAPGMRMRLDALHRYTARLPLVEVPRTIAYDTFLGFDTPSAMILGAVYGIVGAISYYRAHLPAGTHTVLSGGWAQELSKLIDFDVTVDTDLVSRGLNRIITYNEHK